MKTRFRVSKIDGADAWEWQLADGSWKRIPTDIIHWGEHAPGGQATLFAIGELETCFYPPDGGI